jgi:mitogen-activated protein kinase 1/3
MSLEEIIIQFKALNSKYHPQKILGKGSYGLVIKALDTETKKNVAIKCIKADVVNDYYLLQRIVMEIKVLSHFNHENIIRLYDIVIPDMENMQFIYIVMEIADTDLKTLFKIKYNLSADHVKYMMYNLLCGTYILHLSGVMHRDITPANILINYNCDLKLGDFNLAKEYEGQENMTDYVTTRWYRAPELILNYLFRGLQKYDDKIDVWSIGMIFGEFIGGYAVCAGKTPYDQLKKIVEFTGTPNWNDLGITNKMIAKSKTVSIFSQSYYPTDLILKFPNASLEMIDLLKKMTMFDPTKRISIIDAIKHSYFSDLYDPDLETLQLNKFNMKFDKKESLPSLRQKLREIISDFQQKQQTIS